VRFAFIEAEKATFPITPCCAVLGVPRAGFYAWRTRPPSARAGADQRLAIEVAAIHAESRQRYGSPRVHYELGQRQQHVGRKRVARLMRAQGLRARAPAAFARPSTRNTRCRSPRTCWRVASRPRRSIRSG
jgi:transposase InsO family protein